MLRAAWSTFAVAVAIASGVALYAQTRERHVYVGVTTSNGAPVPDLDIADVTVREDDRPREVLRVAPAPPPSHVAIIIDMSAAAQDIVASIRDGVAGFVQSFSTLDTPPAMSIVTFGERPTVESPFTTSLPMTARAVVSLNARPNSGAYFLDAITETADALKKQKPKPVQPVIVAFTIDDATEYSTLRAEDVAAALKEAEASLWVVSLGSGRSGHRERSRVIGDVTRDSGGMNRTTLAQMGIDAAFRAVGSAIMSRYDVVYGRPDSLVPPSRLNVEVRNRAWRVTAPRWAGQ
jgi:hypothetical protein